MIEFHECKTGDFYTNVRRDGDFVWVRVHDHMLPGFHPEWRTFSDP